MPDSLSPAAARRVLLAAQGFGSRPTTVGTRQLNLLLARLRLLQLDSVNVYERSHYLPAAARLGAYDTALLDRLTFGRRSAYPEQWAHEAAIVPVDA
ncbi:DNA glycosylase AlkZ-like family protein, partial [Mesorhizobium japonicum]|uniref:DNA glycosylase AlkZ-like family protein n=1 Tax=Mesorhizobium japonicum TaxID=2066070 RepID=UPI003B5B6385